MYGIETLTSIFFFFCSFFVPFRHWCWTVFPWTGFGSVTSLNMFHAGWYLSWSTPLVHTCRITCSQCCTFRCRKPCGETLASSWLRNHAAGLLYKDITSSHTARFYLQTRPCTLRWTVSSVLHSRNFAGKLDSSAIPIGLTQTNRSRPFVSLLGIFPLPSFPSKQE